MAVSENVVFFSALYPDINGENSAVEENVSIWRTAVKHFYKDSHAYKSMDYNMIRIFLTNSVQQEAFLPIFLNMLLQVAF